MRLAAVLTLAAGLLAALPLTASAGPRMDSRERAIVRAINDHRAEHGLAEVRPSRRLARAADFHSWEMLDANYFAHESRDGGPFHERVRRYANHRAVGETLAMLDRCGRGSARRIVRSWMELGRPSGDSAVRRLPPGRAGQANRRLRRLPALPRDGGLRLAPVATRRDG